MGGSHCETNKDRAASPSTTLWRLTPATPRHYNSSVQAFSVLLGDRPIKKLKVSHSLFVVNYLNVLHVHTHTHYTIPGLFCGVFGFDLQNCHLSLSLLVLTMAHINMMYTVSF